MKVIALMLVVPALVTVPFVAFSAPPTDPYFYEQLKSKSGSYRATFHALFKGQNNLEPWVKRYIEDGNGVDTPRKIRQVGRKSYELYQICEPHNCGGNFLYLLFEPGGAHAWALLTKDYSLVHYFGNPSEEIRAVLAAEAQR
jgi:hypothetical protein